MLLNNCTEKPKDYSLIAITALL